MREPIAVKAGMEITVRGLRWSADWEFDCPTAIIEPVFKPFEDGCSLEHALESFLIDTVIDGRLRDADYKFWEWRGWSQDYLKRKFYRPHVQRLKTKIRFVLDEDKELSWEEVTTT